MFKCAELNFCKWPQASTHTRVHCTPTNMGLADFAFPDVCLILLSLEFGVVIIIKITGLLSNTFGSQINTNGILSFNSGLYRRPQRFLLLDIPLIAPFWVRFQSSGNIFYRVTSDVTLLQRAHDQLQELFPSSGNFTPTTLFIATWDRVVWYLQESKVICIQTVCLLP